jgi:DNA-binding Lrp family transcriptional regulator
MTSNALRVPPTSVSLIAIILLQMIFSGRIGSHEQGAASTNETNKFQLNDRRNERSLDAIDERLIGLLRQDARMKLTALAHAVSLSRTAVQARLARLEREKIILGYRAVIREGNENGLGAILSIVFSQRPCHPVVAKFRHWPEIVHYYSVTGPVDAYVQVRVRDAEALAELLDRFSGLPGVGSASSAVMLRADEWR